MISDDELDSAVAAGAISAEAAAALRAHVAARKPLPEADEEYFRLVAGFNDIFVVIAGVLLLGAIGWIGAAVAQWVGAALIGAAAWGLCEFFVRRRRMALPAIVLLGAFVGSAFVLAKTLLAGTSLAMPGACALALVAALVHWKRFHVPITVAAGAGAAVGLVIGTVVSVSPAGQAWVRPLLFVSGLLVFALAMRWDMSDARRLTGRSDVAFWLHLLAAPLLVHPVFTGIGVASGGAGLVQTALVVALYLAIALVSLAIDRRALMVSALGYVLYAFTALLKETGFVSLGFAVTALLIGSALLLLSAFWQPSRSATLRRLPPRLRARLAPMR